MMLMCEYSIGLSVIVSTLLQEGTLIVGDAVCVDIQGE
jgi:hypothetical protein